MVDIFFVFQWKYKYGEVFTRLNVWILGEFFKYIQFNIQVFQLQLYKWLYKKREIINNIIIYRDGKWLTHNVWSVYGLWSVIGVS